MKMNGGEYWDNGELKRFSIWWVTRVVCYIDYFIRVLLGKGDKSFPDTRTILCATANGVGSASQKITIAMVDDGRPEILLWAANFTPSQARLLAKGMVDMADRFEAFYAK